MLVNFPHDEDEACREFVEHIRGHLNPDQEVICKICGKTIHEIWAQSRQEQKQNKRNLRERKDENAKRTVQRNLHNKAQARTR